MDNPVGEPVNAGDANGASPAIALPAAACDAPVPNVRIDGTPAAASDWPPTDAANMTCVTSTPAA